MDLGAATGRDCLVNLKPDLELKAAASVNNLVSRLC